MMNTEDKPKIPYLGQLGILIGFVIVGAILATIIQFVILFTIIPLNNLMSTLSNEKDLMNILSRPENYTKAVLMQGLGTLVLFAIPAFFVAKLVSKKPFTHLGFSKEMNIKTIGLVVAIAIVGLLLSGGLGEFTKILPMPNKMKLFAENLERKYEAGIMMFVNMKTFRDYVFSLFMIAILPALFEEILFRGSLQNILIKWLKEPHIAIIITGFLFSLVHFSIMGFLSRMMLGIVLGYVYYYSKNLWMSVLMHFINNGVAVTAMYISIKQGKSATESMQEGFPIWIGLAAMIAMIFLLMVYKKIHEPKMNSTF